MAIDRRAAENFEELTERAKRIAWQIRGITQMVGEGSANLKKHEFQAKLEQVIKIGQDGEMQKYLCVQDGSFQYQWHEISDTMKKVKVTERELEGILKLILFSDEKKASAIHQWNQLFLTACLKKEDQEIRKKNLERLQALYLDYLTAHPEDLAAKGNYIGMMFQIYEVIHQLEAIEEIGTGFFTWLKNTVTDLYEILRLDAGGRDLPLANPSNATRPDEPYEKRTNSWKDLVKDYQLLKQAILNAKLWYGAFQEGYQDIGKIGAMKEWETLFRFFCLYEAASNESDKQFEQWQEIRGKLDQLEASDPRH